MLNLVVEEQNGKGSERGKKCGAVPVDDKWPQFFDGANAERCVSQCAEKQAEIVGGLQRLMVNRIEATVRLHSARR